MQVMGLYNILENVESKDHAAYLIRSLRKDESVWSFLVNSTDDQTSRISSLAADQKLNPGTLGLLAFNQELIASGFPEGNLQVAVLEDCMVAYEVFIQQHTPPVSLEEAVKLAIVLIEKKKISPSWSKIFLEIVNRMHLSDAAMLKNLWGTAFAVAVNLIKDQDDLLADLLTLQTASHGIDLLVHSLISLPISDEEMAEKIFAITNEQTPDVIEKILAHLISINERNLAELAGKLCIEKYLPSDETSTEHENSIDALDEALRKSMFYKQIASMAQIAGETDLAGKMISMSIGILDTISNGLMIQNLSLLEQTGRKFEFEEQVNKTRLSDPALLQEFASVGYLPAKNDNGYAEQHPIAALQEAKKIREAGNKELAKLECEKALTDSDADHLDRLVEYQPRFNPNWNPGDIVSTLLEMDATNEAVKAAKKLLARNPASMSANLIASEAFLKAQRYFEALPLLQMLSKSTVDSVEVERTLAECYRQVGNVEASYKVRKQLIDVESPQTEDLLRFAEAAIDFGLPQEVFSATSQIIERDPENTGALSVNGKAYALTGNRELASEYFAKAIEMGTDDPNPWIGLAELYVKDDDYRKAIDTLRSGLSALPKSVEIKRRLAELLMDSGSATEALPYLNELANTTKDLQIKILQAEAMKTLGLAEYKSVIKNLYILNPDNQEIAQAHAAELIREGKRSEAKAVLQQQMIESVPGGQVNLTFADAVVGMDYEHSGDAKAISSQEYEKVQGIIDSCLSEDIENTRAQLLKAELLANKGYHEQAFEAYAKLIEKQNSIDKSLLERIQAGLATSAAFMGKFEVALAAIKQAVEAKPEWIGLRKVLANIYAMAGELSDALEQAVIVLDSSIQIVEGVVWFVDFLSSIGKTEEAESKLREIIAEHPNDLTLQSKLAELLVKSGKLVEAKELAATIAPNITNKMTVEELIAAAQVFDKTGDTTSALMCLEYRSNKNGSLSTQLDLAGYLYKQEQFDKTLEVLSKAGVTEDSISLVNCLKADTLAKTGELQQALDLLQTSEVSAANFVPEEELLFVPETWNKLFTSKQPGMELQAKIAYKLGQASQSQAVVRQWLEGDLENAEAWIVALESNQALGTETDESLNVSLSQADEIDPATAHLAALKMDALLESDQALEAQKIFEKYVSTDNLAVKAAGIRLSLLAGHLSEAEGTFDEILSSRTIIDSTEEAVRMGTIRILVNSAVKLQRWEEALSLSSEAATNYGWHAGSALQYLTVLVRAKEFEHFAKLLSIEAHSPSGLLQQLKMEEEIDWLAGLLIGKFGDTVENWVLRGKMAASQVSENIKAYALVTPSPENASAMISALHQNGQDSTALQVAKKFPGTASVLFALAEIQSESDPEAAIDTLNSLIANEPLMPAALAMRSTLFEKTGKIDLAINDLEQAISDWPNETNWRLMAAVLWERYGNTKNATLQLKAAYDLKPEDEKIALELSKSNVHEGDLDDAIEILSPLTQNNPNLYEAWEVMAEAQSQRGEMEKALDAAKKAIEINPFSTKPYLMSGKIHLDHGNLDKALEHAKKAVSQNKKDADAILFLARVLHQQGEERQALAALEMTNHCENVTVQTMIEHVNLVKEINGGSYAKELIASLSNKYPENVELLKLLAAAQAENGDTSDAEKTAKRALQVDPNEPDLHIFLGKINAESGQLDQAINHLSQGITNKSDKMDGYLMLSKVYEQQREFSKALDALKQAMEAAPTDTRSYVAAANLYKNSKDYSSAEKVLQKAVEIDPRDVVIRRQLGALLALKLVHHSQEASSQS